MRKTGVGFQGLEITWNYRRAHWHFEEEAKSEMTISLGSSFVNVKTIFEKIESSIAFWHNPVLCITCVHTDR